MNLDLTELAGKYELDSYTIEEIREFAMERIRKHKHIRAELLIRLETGHSFNNAPLGVFNPAAYKFHKEKFLKVLRLFEENELQYKMKRDNWNHIRENELPWTDKDIVNIEELNSIIEYCNRNAKTLKKYIEILDLLEKEKLAGIQ